MQNPVGLSSSRPFCGPRAPGWVRVAADSAGVADCACRGVLCRFDELEGAGSSRSVGGRRILITALRWKCGNGERERRTFTAAIMRPAESTTPRSVRTATPAPGQPAPSGSAQLLAHRLRGPRGSARTRSPLARPSPLARFLRQVRGPDAAGAASGPASAASTRRPVVLRPPRRRRLSFASCPPQAGCQLTGSVDTASAASMTAWPGTIFRSARLPSDPLPAPKLVAPALKVNASPVVLA